MEVYLSQVHDGSVSSGFRALYEERLLLDVTLLIEEHHFQVHKSNTHMDVALNAHRTVGFYVIIVLQGCLLGAWTSQAQSCSSKYWIGKKSS